MENMTALFTIGHSRHTAAHFLWLLATHGIKQLVDVRSHPRSKWAPQFDAADLLQLLLARGIHYTSLGEQLGGRPAGREFYRTDGSVDYALRSKAADFVDGISHLVALAQRSPVVILCAEEDPSHCHRRRLVAPALAALGMRVVHVRGDGRVENEAAPAPTQLGLF